MNANVFPKQKKNINLLAIIILMIFPIGQMSIDIYSPSLPAISTYFSSDSAEVKLTISIFIITFAIAQLIFGPLSDQIRRKKPLIISIAIYNIGVLCAIFAAHINMLYIARFLQGFGIAGCMVILKAIVSESFQGDSLKKISSYIAMIFSSSAIFSPCFGGFLQHFCGWRAVFIFLLLYGCISFFLALRILPEIKKEKQEFNFIAFFKNSKTIITNPVFFGFICFQSMILGFFFVFAMQATFVVQKGLGLNASEFGNLSLIIGLSVFIGSFINAINRNYFYRLKLFF